jgi:hypothetical protein
MMGETKGGAQRACCLRPRCIGAVGPRIRETNLHLHLHVAFVSKVLIIFPTGLQCAPEILVNSIFFPCLSLYYVAEPQFLSMMYWSTCCEVNRKMSAILNHFSTPEET